ncbi:hypothetical protein Hypma_012293 [Hypsizygus marmoreus]|uniref:Uncharacterized protein n=1 Tax=Hypsizygus marmoreus TaxID=39966 RepID=A0A369JF52_HYPMA|nr:hypothetical protein Hypma_012293 [Hypsizygus marmoreus]
MVCTVCFILFFYSFLCDIPGPLTIWSQRLSSSSVMDLSYSRHEVQSLVSSKDMFADSHKNLIIRNPRGKFETACWDTFLDIRCVQNPRRVVTLIHNLGRATVFNNLPESSWFTIFRDAFPHEEIVWAFGEPSWALHTQETQRMRRRSATT